MDKKSQLWLSIAAELKKIAWLAFAVVAAIGYTQVDIWVVAGAIAWFLVAQSIAHVLIWLADPG